MITKNEKIQIKAILQDPKWGSIENLANDLCDKVALESVVKSTEWETLHTALINEGKIRGIRQFIQELFAHAQDV